MNTRRSGAMLVTVFVALLLGLAITEPVAAETAPLGCDLNTTNTSADCQAKATVHESGASIDLSGSLKVRIVNGTAYAKVGIDHVTVQVDEP